MLTNTAYVSLVQARAAKLGIHAQTAAARGRATQPTRLSLLIIFYQGCDADETFRPPGHPSPYLFYQLG